MKNNLVVGMALGTFSGLVLGVGATLVLVGGDTTPQLETSKPGVVTSATSETSSGDGDSDAACASKLARLQRAYQKMPRMDHDQAHMIDELEDMLIKAGGASPDGTPMDFPENAPYAHTPEGFEQVVNTLQDECPGLLPEDAETDCTEFPCMIVGTSEGRPRWNAYRSCDAWSAHFGEGSGLRYRPLHGEGDKFAVTMRPAFRDDDDELRDYVKEFNGNYNKRARARTNDYFTESVVAHAKDACEVDGNGTACYDAGVALSESQPDRAANFLEQGCEVGAGRACNHLAWTKCHDNKNCDEQALDLAEQAVELSPNDGRGALDTLAFVLCQRGDTSSSNEMYKRSCDAGYKQNCTKTCG